MRDAKNAISRAEEYIADHKSAVGKTAENRLHDAKNMSESVGFLQDIQRKIALLEEVKDKADGAYKEAKSDFRDAEEERDRARRVHSSSGSGSVYAPVIVHTETNYGGSSGFSDDGGGGSSSWGSTSSSDSGGSSSWGSSDSGGVGSTDW